MPFRPIAIIMSDFLDKGVDVSLGESAGGAKLGVGGNCDALACADRERYGHRA
jgi:hypothetical protein